MIALAVVAAVIAAASASAPAPAAAVRFAPPIDRAILYETEQTRIANGEPQRYRMVNRLRFAPLPRGQWRLELTMAEVTAQARVDFETLFLAGMRPFLDVPVVLRLSATGVPVEVLNEAEAWGRVTTALKAAADELSRKNGGDSAAVRETRAYFDRFAALDGTARRQRLMDTVGDVLPPPLPALRTGETRPWEAGADGGMTATGIITGRPTGYSIETETVLADPSLPHLVDRTEIDMDRATGLIRSTRTTKKIGDKVLAEEATRQLP